MNLENVSYCLFVTTFVLVIHGHVGLTFKFNQKWAKPHVQLQWSTFKRIKVDCNRFLVKTQNHWLIARKCTYHRFEPQFDPRLVHWGYGLWAVCIFLNHLGQLNERFYSHCDSAEHTRAYCQHMWDYWVGALRKSRD